MKKILVIESSPRGDQSVSRKLTREIVTKLRAKYPDSEVNTRDLSVTPFPHIQEDEIKAFYSRLLNEKVPGESLSFLKLLGKGDTVQAVRMFIMLLFLAIERKVSLVQTEEFGDIQIEVVNNGSPGPD